MLYLWAICSSKSLFSTVGGEQEAMKTFLSFHLFLDRKPNKQKAETLLHPACCEKAHGVECETFSGAQPWRGRPLSLLTEPSTSRCAADWLWPQSRRRESSAPEPELAWRDRRLNSRMQVKSLHMSRWQQGDDRPPAGPPRDFSSGTWMQRQREGQMSGTLGWKVTVRRLLVEATGSGEINTQLCWKGQKTTEFPSYAERPLRVSMLSVHSQEVRGAPLLPPSIPSFEGLTPKLMHWNIFWVFSPTSWGKLFYAQPTKNLQSISFWRCSAFIIM